MRELIRSQDIIINKDLDNIMNLNESDDPLGLKKLEKTLKSVGSKTFPEPKPVYTKYFEKYPRYMDGDQYRKKKASQDTQKAIDNAKIVINETKKTIKSLHDIIKNRKIIHLEKEALKTKTKADQLAHEIKTKTALIDSMNDVKRYEQEKEKIDQELEQARKGEFKNE